MQIIVRYASDESLRMFKCQCYVKNTYLYSIKCSGKASTSLEVFVKHKKFETVN